MSEPFLAEIRIVAFNFAPRGWAFCDGQSLPINQNQSLYSLLGTTYGGDGRTSFALPDLRGRVPIHHGSSNGGDHLLGAKGGEETHTLSAAETPNHGHTLRATSAAAAALGGTDNVLAQTSTNVGAVYSDENERGNVVQLASAAIATTGGQAHENMQPFLTLNFCIALMGLFPSRN